MVADQEAVLSVSHLRLALSESDVTGNLVEDLSFEIGRGEMLAFVGESGSGKSLTAAALLGLLPPGIKQTSGSIRLGSQELTMLSERQWRRIRGRDIGFVFQNPLTALNPSASIRAQIEEVLRVHAGGARRHREDRAAQLLREVGLADLAGPQTYYPHQLSGGMRQRALIAIALACNPRLLIADEPTTALDVLVQAQILDLLARLQRERGLAILFITHDLTQAARYAQRVLVLYAGRFMEEGNAAAFFKEPRHPYSRALRDAIPAFGQETNRLFEIPGSAPEAGHYPPCCRFAPRCTRRTKQCEQSSPPLSAGATCCACFHPYEAHRP